MNLTTTETTLTAVQALLTAHLPERFTVTVDEAELTTGAVTVVPVTSPQKLVYAPLGGGDKARMLIQVTICDKTPRACRLAGDRVRTILTGTTVRNRPTTPLEVEGWTFDLPSTVGDGRGTTAGGVHTWRETFEVAWQPRA